MPCTCNPAIMVNRAVTKHLKVLSGMPIFGFWVIESINHGRSIERELLSAIHHPWKRQTGRLQYGRCNIYDVTKLRSDLSFGFDTFGPMHYHSVARASPVRSNLLGPLERSIQRMRPANGIVRESIRASPVINMIHHLGSSADNTIQSHHLVI